MRTVRFVDLPWDFFGPLRIRRRRDFEVQGAGFFEASDDALFAPLLVIQEASLTSLRHAIASYNNHCEGPADDALTLFITNDHPHVFDPDLPLYLPTRLRVSPSTVEVVLETNTQELLPGREPVLRLLSPLLKKRRATVTGVMPIDSPRGGAVEVTIRIATRGRTVADALALGNDVELLLDAAFATGALRPETAGQLLRTGHHEVLIGQPESEWLEAKDRVYVFADDDVGRFHLARDVASFANAAGGLLAVGLQTSKVAGRDTISRARGVPLAGFKIASYQSVLRSWIYPVPVGVSIDVIEIGERRGIVVIEIPQQSTALKPFFVRRAQLADRVRTEHFALPIRRGDATLYGDLAELHSLIVAGRVALTATPPSQADAVS